MVDDWWHDFANDIATALLSKGGYNGQGAVAPPPDTALIQGVGLFNCNATAAPHGCNTTATEKIPEVYVAAGQTHRLRFINSGSHAQQFVSIDEQ